MAVLTHAAKFSKMYKKFTPRQYMAVGVIILALAAMTAIGFMIGRNSAAEAIRDCGDEAGGVHNSIANNSNSGGGCGALSPDELITDIINGNPDDQAGVMAHFGLPAGKYDEFKDAKMGVAKTNGDIEVGGKVVMTNAWSIGRVKFSYSSDYPIEGVGEFFRSAHTDVLKQNIPVMVMFDEEGTVETAVLTSCGNPANGDKVKSSAKCKKLNVEPAKDKEDTYSFTTEVELTGLAEVEKVEYFAGGELFGSEPNPSTPVTKTFTESATVTTKITVRLPGDKKKLIEDEICTAKIEVKEKEAPRPPKEEEKPKPKVLPAKVEEKVKVEEKELPVTGPADAAALFFGTSLAGATGHHIYTVYRSRRQR